MCKVKRIAARWKQHGLQPLISNKGRIQDFTGHRYFPKAERDGRCSFSMKNRSTNHHALIPIHRLVHILFNDPNLEMFHGGFTVDHENRNPSDNRCENLRWLDKSGQQLNQDDNEQCFAKFRYRFSNSKSGRVVDLSSRKDVGKFFGLSEDLIQKCEVSSESFEFTDWKVEVLNNSWVIAGEKWKNVVGTRISISSLGRVQCWKRRYYPRINSNGYCGFHTKGVFRRMHVAVMMAFGANKVDGYNEVDHCDRNPGNNSIENLRWANRSIQSKNRTLYKKPSNRPMECKPVTFDRWVMYPGGSNEVLEKLGIKKVDSCNTANERHHQKTALGFHGVRYHIRMVHADDQKDIDGEEWKPIVLEDWDIDGKYYCIAN